MRKRITYTIFLLALCGAVITSAESAESEAPEVALTKACDNLIEKGRSAGPAGSRLARLTQADFAADGKPLTENARVVVAAKARSLDFWSQAFRVCLDAADRVEDPQTASYLVARGHWIEGWRLEQNQSWDQARVVYEQGLDAVDGRGGAMSPHLVPLHESLADLLLRDENTRNEAKAHLEKALEIRRQAFGAESPRVAPGLIRLAMLHAQFENEKGESAAGSEEVEALYRRAIDLLEEAGGEPKELFARALRTYQLYRLGRQEYEKAESIRVLAESHGVDLEEVTPDWRYFWGRWVDRE